MDNENAIFSKLVTGENANFAHVGSKGFCGRNCEKKTTGLFQKYSIKMVIINAFFKLMQVVTKLLALVEAFVCLKELIAKTYLWCFLERRVCFCILSSHAGPTSLKPFSALALLVA